MKTTVVPAQITTVEDRIAGSLTLPQIVLMVMAMVIGSVIYAVVVPKLHFGAVKMTLIAIEILFFGSLSLRFNGKIVGEWLVIFLRFKSRPRRYVFTKNDPIHREVILESDKKEISDKQNDNANNIEPEEKPLSLIEELNMQKIYYNDSLSISFKPSKKGGLDVTLKKES
jgi:hypothetical protein